MSDVNDRNRILARLKAFHASLASTESLGPPDLKGDYNELVAEAQRATGENLIDFFVGDDFLTTRSQSVGFNLGPRFNAPMMDMVRFRSKLGQLIAHLEPSPAQSSNSHQIVLSFGEGNQVSVTSSGRDSSVKQSYEVQAGDAVALIEALKATGVPQESLEDLKQGLQDAPDDPALRQRTAMAWLGSFITQAGANALGSGAITALPTITALITSYSGM